MTCEVVRDDRDEAGRKAALGNERARRVDRELLYVACACHILGQIQIVCGVDLGCLGDTRGEAIGRGAEHRELAADEGLERATVGDVEGHLLHGRIGFQPIELVARAVGHRDGVVAGMGEEVDDHRADVPAPDHCHLFHASALRVRYGGQFAGVSGTMPWSTRRLAGIIPAVFTIHWSE